MSVRYLFCVQAAVDLPPVEGEKGCPTNRSTDWTSLEDEVLRRAHQKHGEEEGKWAKISGYFTRRKLRDCSNRWRFLRPALHPAPLPEEIDDSDYKELVGKSDLVTKVSFPQQRD